MRGLVWVLLIVAFAPAAYAAERKPNIVFILADDLGINDLSCYGRKDQTTPHLDRLAAQGMRFERSYCAQPICSPSRAGIMTGKAPARLHLTTYLPGRPDAVSQKLLHPKIQQQLATEEQTMAEGLKSVGYRTACIGKWHLGGKGFLPQDQGFDFVYTGTANTKPTQNEGGKGEYDLTAQAIRFIEQNRDQPFLLYLPHNNPHIPINEFPDRVAKHKDAFNPIYAATIATLDDSIGRLMKTLDDLKLTNDTIVIFTSDNGGLHVLEGGNTPATHNTPFRAGKGFVYEGGLRVPAIVRWPGHVPAGQVNQTPLHHCDWVPTLNEIAGVKSPGSLDGISMLPALQGKAMPDRALFWHFPHYTNQGSRPAGAMIDGNWKLVEHYEDGSHELYDLSTDIGERTNIAAKHPERVKSMAAALAKWRDDLKVQTNSINPEFDATKHRELYIDMDVSQLTLQPTAAEMRVKLEKWRAGMNNVLPKKR